MLEQVSDEEVEVKDVLIGESSASGRTLPVDKGDVVYIIFFLLGAGILFPWNVFITAVDYFDVLYPSRDMDRLFGALYMAPNLITLCLLVLYGQNFSNKVKVIGGFIGYLVAIISVPIMDLLLGPAPGEPSSFMFYLTLILVAETGIADAIAQGSLYGMAGLFPPRYTQALMAGTSGSGFLVSLLRVVTKASLPSTFTGLRISATIYFLVSFLFVLLCLASFMYLPRTEFVQFYTRNTDKSMELTPLRTAEKGTEHQGYQKLSRAGAMSILRQIWPYATMVAYTYLVTLTLFPGFVTENLHWDSFGSWYPVLMITVFNFGDLIGKIHPSYQRIDSLQTLCIFVTSRTLFLPLFWICGKTWGNFNSPWMVFMLVFFLGWTNGYLGCLLMMIAPGKCVAEDSELAGTTMVFFLIFGLTLGAFLGWIWVL